jgi:hypothetical protein
MNLAPGAIAQKKRLPSAADPSRLSKEVIHCPSFF